MPRGQLSASWNHFEVQTLTLENRFIPSLHYISRHLRPKALTDVDRARQQARRRIPDSPALLELAADCAAGRGGLEEDPVILSCILLTMIQSF